MKEYTKKNLELVEVAENLTLENSVLQKKVRELLDANKDVTINYQVIKKNYDSRKKEAEEVAKESDEAKNACQLLIKQKRSQREEIEGLVKQKVQLESSLSSAKSELMALSAENEDLQNRIKELEIEEERLKKQIRSSSRIKSSSTNLLKSSNGNLMKNSTSDLLKNSRMDLLKNSNGNLLNGSTHSLLKGLTSSMLKENSDIEISKAPEVQEEAVTDFDKQALLNTFQLKMDETINEMKFEFEKIQSQLCDELDFTQENLEERIMESAKLESVIKKLQEEQYLPRMQYLHTLEVEMKEKLLDLAMEDEKMELNLICPRDLKLLDRATTLSPCGHSFCKTCVKQMSLENFDQLKCDVCKTKTSETFSNYKLDQLKEQLLERKKKMKVILAW